MKDAIYDFFKKILDKREISNINLDFLYELYLRVTKLVMRENFLFIKLLHQMNKH